MSAHKVERLAKDTNWKEKIVRGKQAGRSFIVMVAAWLAVLAGCQSEKPAESQSATPAQNQSVEAKKPAVDPMNPPSGSVRQIWTNGDCMIDIGTEVGVENGDWLIVIRKGQTVQYIEVANAKPYSSFCRVAVPTQPGRARVGDTVMLEPKNLRDIHGSAAH